MIEDRVLSRTVGVLGVFILFVFMFGSLVPETAKDPERIVDKLSFGSNVPAEVTISHAFMRSPRVTVLDSNGELFEDKAVNVSLADVRFATEPKNSLDCDTTRRRLRTDTLEEVSTREACAVVLTGMDAVTGDQGNATFDQIDPTWVIARLTL